MNGASKALFLISVLLAGYIVYTYISLQPVLETGVPEDRSGQEERVLKIEKPDTEFHMEGIAEVLNTRDIFAMPYNRDLAKGEKDEGIDVVGTPSQEMLFYRVIGVMIDQKPVAILEDSRTSETVVLSEGASLEGAVVKDVQADRVLFKKNGKTWEIGR